MTQSRTTFDASTEPGAFPPPDSLIELPDTLELLRERADEVVTINSTTVFNPTGHIRLICRGNIDSKEIQRWNRRALPPVARKNGNASGLDTDQVVLYSAVLAETTEYVEVLGRDGAWKAVEDTDHNPLTFKDQALLGAFKSLDAAGAIKSMFVRDSAIVKAGVAVLTGAGWSEGSTGLEEDDDLDPTV